MKILYICSYTGLTGATQVMLSNIESLMSEAEFFVVLPGKGPLEGELKARGIKVYRIKYFNWIIPSKMKQQRNEKVKWLIKKIVNCFSTLLLLRIILKNKISIIQINSLYTDFGFWAGRVLRRKVIWYAQEVPEGTSDMRFWNRKKMLNELNRADGVVCVSNFVRQYILSCGVLPQKTKVVYNATDMQINVENKRMLHDPVRISVIAGVANYQKNQLLALQAVKALTGEGYSIVLNFFGINENSDDRKYFLDMKEYIRKNKIDEFVNFYGFIKEKKFIYDRTDITLSCALDEAFGLTITESMIRKIPVVATDSGGTKELLNGGENGGTFSSNNGIELKQQLKKVIDDSKYRANIVDSAYKFVNENCNPQKVSSEILKFYKSIN